MSDSLLDQALRFCDGALQGMCDTSTKRQLQARHGVLVRAARALPLMPATEAQIVRLAELVLTLRDDVSQAAKADELFTRTCQSAVFRVAERHATRRDVNDAA